MKEISISKAQEGQRLDRFLGKCLPEATGGFLHKMLRKKNIKLNGQKAEGNEKLQSGDKIQLFFSDETYEKFSGKAANASQGQVEKREQRSSAPRLNKEQLDLRKQVKVLYKDEHIVILHKPAGMLSQKSVKTDDSLNDYLLDLCKKEGWVSEEDMKFFHPSVANRLDRNTSGIVLCGITTAGLQMLSKTLRDRTIAKYYMAIVQGQVTSGRRVKGYLQKDTEKNVVHFSTEAGEDSVPIETEYEVVKTGREASLLRIRLITGKSHQIRAHLASEGYPILGDYKYGERRANQKLKTQMGISYQMLHSCEIDFGKHLGGLVVKDPLPAEFQNALRFYHLG